MIWTDRVASEPGIMLGKPVIRGTRITVETILKKLGSGMTYEEILRDYPHLTLVDIHAAIAYAADALSTDELVIDKA